MAHLTRRGALAGMGTVLLTGCGGGDGNAPPPTGMGPTPTPTPTPSPTPTPTPPPSVGSFGTLGASSSQTFASLGYSERGSGSGGDFVPVSGSLTAQPGHSMRLEAPSRLLLKLPTLGEGELVARSNEGSSFRGERVDAMFNVLGGICQLVRPIVADALQKYVLQGYFVSAPNADSSQSNLLLTFAYGIATASGGIPVSGAADFATNNAEKGFTFHADYVARVMTGSIPFFVNGSSLSTFLKDVVISGDGTRFSGRLLPPDGSPEGTIDGIFMGPSGEEFIALTVLKSGQA